MWGCSIDVKWPTVLLRSSKTLDGSKLPHYDIHRHDALGGNLDPLSVVVHEREAVLQPREHAVARKLRHLGLVKALGDDAAVVQRYREFSGKMPQEVPPNDADIPEPYACYSSASASAATIALLRLRLYRFFVL